MNKFLEIMRFRHACKLFDDKKQIPKNDFETILEAARLSPSSFGLEPWRFLVIRDIKMKNLFKAACWNQPQVATCSHFVILLSKKPKFFKEGSSYLNEAFGRRAKDKNAMASVQKAFHSFVANDLGTDVKNWAKMQVYIAGANMMNAAAFLGIDSCPMEGFNSKALKKALVENIPSFDKNSYDTAFVIAFGYRLGEPKDKIRWSIDQIAEFID